VAWITLEVAVIVNPIRWANVARGILAKRVVAYLQLELTDDRVGISCLSIRAVMPRHGCYRVIAACKRDGAVGEVKEDVAEEVSHIHVYWQSAKVAWIDVVRRGGEKLISNRLQHGRTQASRVRPIGKQGEA
jgi:hypothetical protein